MKLPELVEIYKKLYYNWYIEKIKCKGAMANGEKKTF